MKFYDLDTEFTFGIYKGYTLKSILKIRPTYIIICIYHLDHFYISEEVIQEMISLNPNFKVPDKLLQILKARYLDWKSEKRFVEQEYIPEPDYDRDTFYALTDGMYGDYDDFNDNGGNISDLKEELGF